MKNLTWSKKIYFSAATMLFGFGAFAQNTNTLMTVGSDKVGKQEFENVFKKNNSKLAANPDEKTLREYLDLYINFKLKVLEAKSFGMDTAAPFKKELAGYRKQLAAPYLTDKEVTEQLINEAYDRSKKEIRASHILINCKEELTDSLLNNPKLMFMEYINPKYFHEYTIDAYYDKNSQLRCLVPRRRIEVRGGEISKGKTEKPDFYKYLSALQNLELLARASGVKDYRKRSLELMDFVGLSGRENDKVSSFSHGMRQRLGLAQCLLHDPDLVVLDEPGTGLDPQGLVDMREMIQNLHREQGKTILLSSHHLSEVEAVATDLVVVDRGRCVVQGSAKALLSQSERQIRITVGRADEALALLNAGPWAGRGRLNDRGELTGALGREEVPSAVQFLTQNGFEVYAIESRQKLEDYYMNLLNHHPTES